MFEYLLKIKLNQFYQYLVIIRRCLVDEMIAVFIALEQIVLLHFSGFRYIQVYFTISILFICKPVNVNILNRNTLNL